eukprot:366551-Chlamydomonas_euryale.AAC.2
MDPGMHCRLSSAFAGEGGSGNRAGWVSDKRVQKGGREASLRCRFLGVVARGRVGRKRREGEGWMRQRERRTDFRGEGAQGGGGASTHLGRQPPPSRCGHTSHRSPPAPLARPGGPG